MSALGSICPKCGGATKVLGVDRLCPRFECWEQPPTTDTEGKSFSMALAHENEALYRDVVQAIAKHDRALAALALFSWDEKGQVSPVPSGVDIVHAVMMSLTYAAWNIAIGGNLFLVAEPAVIRQWLVQTFVNLTGALEKRACDTNNVGAASTGPN